MGKRGVNSVGPGPQSVRRAVELLMVIARSPEQVSVTEMARRLGVHASTVSRLLKALEAYQLVTQDAQTLRFDLGPTCLQLGQVFLSRVEISEIAEPYMHTLTRQTGLMTHLAVLRAGQVVHLKHVLPDPPLPCRPVAERYAVGHVHAEALGKVLLAFQPDDVIQETLSRVQLKRLTEATITSRRELLRELEQVRKAGYAVDNGECVPYIRCVAVPIWNHTGKVEAALSLSGLREHIGPENAPLLAQKLNEVAGEISRRIGARPSAALSRGPAGV